MTVHVEVQIATGSDEIPATDSITSWVVHAVAAVAQDTTGDVSVRVVDVAEMQTLNRDFRDKDAPTNVLSFPAGEMSGLPMDLGVPLGDIVVCASVVNDEARQQGKSSADHWAHMIVHGTLHLLGYDHENDDEASVMEGVERRILAANGIADPYAELAAET